MRCWILISIFGIIGAVKQCDLTKRKPDRPFPNIETDGATVSYQMSVEYTIPEVMQTDFYTEYYDILLGQGRVDSHQAGYSFSYVYRAETWEAWEINKEKCVLKNITDTPEFYKDGVTDWTYAPSDKPDKRTIGPSAMFKTAYDVWNSDPKRNLMSYMGLYEGKVRGLNAHYWRRCDTERSYVDYFFKADGDESPFGLPGFNLLPLRVFFGGTREGVPAELSNQQYEVMSFQPYISPNLRPFELPIGKGCARGLLEGAPEIPDFTNKDLEFSAEVIYSTQVGVDPQYHSTLHFDLDLGNSHLAYHYTPWSTTKEKEETDVEAPSHIIYDIKNGYLYEKAPNTSSCVIYRQKTFIPQFKLPNDIGTISLTDPFLLFPTSESTFITQSTIRGLRVNIFEVVVEDYVIYDNDGFFYKIPKAVITHAYLQDDIISGRTVSVENSLVQVQMRFSGRRYVTETVTLNFFGFTTELRDRSHFNIQSCFIDNYVMTTIGFNAREDKIQKIINEVPNFQSAIVNAITLKLELNPVRTPDVEVVVKDGIFVSMMILEKPPVILDYMEPERDQTILGTTEKDVESFDSCAEKCLETESNCWGFSMCGSVCYFGTADATKVGPKQGCKLYRRYDMENFIPSVERVVKTIRKEIDQNEFRLKLKDRYDNIVEMNADHIAVTYPGEDD